MLWSSAGQGSWRLLRCWSRTVRPRTLPAFRRTFCVSAPAERQPHEKQPVKQWALTVSPFSTVRAQVGCGISVSPLDPHAFPQADRAFISVHNRHTDTKVGVCVDHVNVQYDEQSNELLISAEKANSNLLIDLTAPIKSNVFITSKGKGNVQVKNMECDFCKVHTETGNCLLQSVKAHQVEVQSNGGDVIGVGTIHGNVDISTHGHSGVDVKKLQGTKMNVSTEHGPLKVKVIYAESSCVSTCSGKVELGHVHGNATVKNMSGDTVIDGSNSFLKVSSNSGGIDVYVGDGCSTELHSQEGMVCVRTPPSLRAAVELSGASVEISPEVVLHGVEHVTTQRQTTVTGRMNVASPVTQWVKAQADRGPVRLTTQSWFDSLKLGI